MIPFYLIFCQPILRCQRKELVPSCSAPLWLYLGQLLPHPQISLHALEARSAGQSCQWFDSTEQLPLTGAALRPLSAAQANPQMPLSGRRVAFLRFTPERTSDKGCFWEAPARWGRCGRGWWTCVRKWEDTGGFWQAEETARPQEGGAAAGNVNQMCVAVRRDAWLWLEMGMTCWLGTCCEGPWRTHSGVQDIVVGTGASLEEGQLWWKTVRHRGPGFEIWFHHLLALWLWAKWATLSLGLLICKIRSCGVVRIKRENKVCESSVTPI